MSLQKQLQELIKAGVISEEIAGKITPIFQYYPLKINKLRHVFLKSAKNRRLLSAEWYLLSKFIRIISF